MSSPWLVVTQSGQANVDHHLHPAGHGGVRRLDLETSSPDAQDLILDQACRWRPMTIVVVVWVLVGKLRGRRRQKRDRTRLITLFEKQTVARSASRWRCARIEVNEYRREGLEEIAPQLREVFSPRSRVPWAISSITCVAWRPVTWRDRR